MKIFKKTKIFKELKLSDITNVKDGTHDSPKYVDEGVPFITSKNLLDDHICFENVNKITYEDHEKFYKRSNVKNGDVLMGMVGTIGNPVVVNTNKVFSIKNVALIKENNILDSFLIKTQLENKFVKDQINILSAGGVLSFLKLSDIRALILKVPEKSDQELIKKVLIQEKDIIKKIKTLLEKIEIRNNYYADKLLSGELSVGEDGKILNVQNNNYKLKKIKEIVDISIGSTPSIEEYNGNIPWITIADLSKNIEQTNKQLKKSIKSVEAGSLIISFKLTVGLAKIIHQESCTNEAILRIEPSKIKEDVSIDYLYCILPNLLKQYSGKNAYGASILNTKEIKEIPVKIFRDHKNISVFLKSLEDEKNKVTKLLQLEQQRFEWLSDKLLSGEYIIED